MCLCADNIWTNGTDSQRLRQRNVLPKVGAVAKLSLKTAAMHCPLTLWVYPLPHPANFVLTRRPLGLLALTTSPELHPVIFLLSLLMPLTVLLIFWEALRQLLLWCLLYLRCNLMEMFPQRDISNSRKLLDLSRLKLAQLTSLSLLVRPLKLNPLLRPNSAPLSLLLLPPSIPLTLRPMVSLSSVDLPLSSTTPTPHTTMVDLMSQLPRMLAL